MLTVAVVLITAALFWYTLGVWAERLHRDLRPWHAVCFVAGLACDVSGTIVMTRIAAAGTVAGASSNGFVTVMAWTGSIAIALMAIHAGWAVVVLVLDREQARHRFHRFSLAVWLLWLVPYFTGAIGANLR